MNLGARTPLVANRYRLDSELGRGASSQVYRAYDEEAGGAAVALKLFGGPSASAEAWARFRREAEALTGLEHPNIVRVFSLGDHEGAPYLAMELVGGGSLDAELQARAEGGRPPSCDEVGRWLLGAARGLAFAHARGVVHRDLKPANLLLDEREGGSEIKIADFGVAMLTAADEPSRAWVVGTPAYMAPEQCYAIEAEVDERSDLFALGVVAYELLTGRRPFRAATLAQYARELAAGRPEPPRNLRAGVDPMLEAIALKLLRIRPDERYQTARGLAHDLERWARHGLGVVFELGSRRGSLAGRTPLVGRSAELARLEGAWQRACAGDGGALWVEGAPGMGKTRLLDALGPSVLGGGGRLVRGKNYELVTPSPFRALADAVRDLLAQLELETDDERQEVEGRLRRALEGRADTLVRILPELSSLLGSVRAGQPPLAPEGGSLLLRDAFAQLFTALASTARPLALVVDDAQWSDDDSLAVLRALGRAAEGHAMLLVVARRRAEAPESVEARPWGGAAGAPAALELAPLRDAAVVELVEGLLGEAPREVAAAAAAWVAPRAAGNPLFVRELVLGLVACGALACEAEAGWSFDGARLVEAEPPPNVSAALVRRAALVGEGAREVLGAAAAVGPVVPREALEALCAGLPAGAVGRALDEACRHALLGRGAGDTYFFTSEEARRALYERAGPRERAALHRTLLGRYEAARAAGGRVPASELVRHALAVADVGRVARYAAEAAREAEAVYAHQSAVRYYELAIASATPPERPALLVALAGALLSAGRYDEAAAAARRAEPSAPERAAVFRVLASAHFARGLYAEATEALERALAARGRPSTRSRWALTRQALAAWAPGPPPAPAAGDEVEVLDTLGTFYFFTDTFTFVATLLAACRRLRDDPRPDARMWARASFAVLAYLLGLRGLARAESEGAAALEAEASLEGKARTLTKLALYHQMRDAADEGLATARRAADACRRVGDLWGLASSLDMQASMRFARGDLAGAAREADRLLEVVDEYDILQRRPRALQLTAYFGFLLGRVEAPASFEQLARSRRLAASLGDDLTEAAGAWMEADLALLTGDAARAVALCRRGHRLLREQPRLHPDASYVEATYVRALVRAGLGARPSRRDLARLLAVAARSIAVGAWFPALVGVGRGARALAADFAAPGSERARAWWDEAARALDERGDLIRLAYLRLDRALLRRAGGDDGWSSDRDEALSLLSRAGAEGAVRALAPLAEALRVAPAAPGGAPRSTANDPTLEARRPPVSSPPTAELARVLEEREQQGEAMTLRALVTQVSRGGKKLGAAVFRRGTFR
ncbi:MAG TPA: protein kinase [Polyangiaceae bacterium]|nr:protein kinase [Polyangiaceae bacterium]